MERRSGGLRAVPRVAWIAGLALAATLAGILLILLPDFLDATPIEIQIVVRHPLLWLGLSTVPLCLGAEPFEALLRRRRPKRVIESAGKWCRRVAPKAPAVAVAVVIRSLRLDALRLGADSLAGRLFVPLSAAIGGTCALFLLTWAPHYLTWPAWADNDQFMVSAQSWDAGIRPYRDLPDFDFPGPIYLFYALGKTFGWGRTVPIYAVDLTLLLVMGWALVAWSRRVFGAALPGLVGYLSFLGYYLGLDYSHVAQRDWQAPALMVLGILALEARPGSGARFFSAATFALALSIRPQVVLFLPAILSALDESARRPDEAFSRVLRALIEWSAALAASVLVVFSPLIVAGVLDDFLRVLTVAQYGGSYNRTTWFSFQTQFKFQFIRPWTTKWWTYALILLGIMGPMGLRRPARTWALALFAAFLYRPLSPVPHDYLIHPLRLMQSIALAPLFAGVLSMPWLTHSSRFVGLALLLYAAAPAPPRFCTGRGSFEALGPLTRGESPERPPPGCLSYFPPSESGFSDSWDHYRQLLEYLRHEPRRDRPVANLLRAFPFPAVNGPAGRLTPFPAAGGFLYLWLVNPTEEDRFAEALCRHPDSLIVWTPDDPLMISALKFSKIEAMIRLRFRPLARFGRIHIWERSDGIAASEQKKTTEPRELQGVAP